MSSSPALCPVVNNGLVRLIAAPHTLDNFADVETVVIGQQMIDDHTLKTQYAVRFSSADAATESQTKAVLSRPNSQFGYGVGSVDISYKIKPTDERTVIATFSRVSPRLAPDNSPDVSFSLQDDRTTLAQTGNEPVAPANLELRVDRERRTPPWAGRESPITPGTSFAVEFDPFRLVEIVWTDPEYDGLKRPLFRELIRTPTADVFESTYDPDAETVTIEYTLATKTRAEWFTVKRSPLGGNGEQMRRELESSVGETLTPGESLQIDNVNYGDQVEMDVIYQYQLSSGLFGTGAGTTASSIGSHGAGGDSTCDFRFSVDPPSKLSFQNGDSTVTITYRGNETVPAESYRSRYKSRVGNLTQFTDRYDQLTNGDAVTVDAAVGDQLIFERPAPGQSTPAYLGSYLVVPEANFDICYDAGAKEITVTHAGGSPLDPDQLALDTRPSAILSDETNPWSGQSDAVKSGDVVTVAVDREPYAVRVLFNGGVIATIREF